MSEPDNLALVLLREMRADMNARFDAIENRLDAMDRRLDVMHRNGEKALRGFIGYRAIVERTMASFEDDISSLKRRVEQLETAQA